MSHGGVLGHIVTCTSMLMVRVGSGAGCTGVPDGNVKTACVAVVEIVVSLVGIWRGVAAVSCGAGRG